MSNRKRRAAHRAEPVRGPIASRVHDLTPARLAQGGVVAVLVAGLCTTITAQASASGSDSEGRTAAVAEARDGAVDVATDALAVAHAVQARATTSGVSPAKLAELTTAAAHVDELVARAEKDGATASATAAPTGSGTASAQASTGASGQSTAGQSTADQSTAGQTAAGQTASTSGASAAPTATDAPSASADESASSDAAASADEASGAPTTADAPAAGGDASTATSTAGAAAAGPTVAGSTVAGAAKSAPPAPGANATTASTATGADGAAADDTAGDGTTANGSAADGTAASDVLDEKVPTIPVTSGPEDRTTEDLRDAVAQLAAIAAEIQDAVADETAQHAASDAAAAEKAAADEAAAEKSAADKAAANKAAAAEKAAQRAAWKKSLQGYPNGRIPAKALCGVPFDKDVLLRCDAAEALTKLDKAYVKAFGHHLQVTDSYRSYAAQVACRATKGSLCATPGTSNHGWGVAVDLGDGIQSFTTSTHRWMNANAAKYGWKHPGWAEPGGSKPEPWHWEYVG